MFRALRHRNYQLFFSGQLISLTGTWMQSVAESWLVYRLTGSSALLGVSAFFAQIPVFLLAPLGGAAASGLLVAAVGEAWCFLINAISYIAVIAGLVMMTVPHRRAAGRIHVSAALHDIIEGFRFVGRTRPVRALLILLGIVSFAGM